MATTTMQPATTNLNSEDFAAFLKKIYACSEACDWVEGKDLVTAWTTCHRSDWLLWLLDKAAPLDTITNEFLTCRFAREVHHLNPDPRVLACIETREAWARGEVSDEVRAAALAAARAAAGPIWDPAKIAAEYAARAAADNTNAVYAAGAAIRAATDDTARADAWDTARADAWAATWALAQNGARSKQADIIRELVPMPVLA